MKHKKRALFQSVISLMLCLSMLVGTTFAWFTDSVSSTGNIIKSGNLKISMKWTADLENQNWQDASKVAIFDYSNWEPGYTDLKYLQISNDGNLAFQYQLTLEEGSAPNNGISAEGGETAETQEMILDGGEVAAIDETGGDAGIITDGGTVTPGAAVSDAMKLAEVIDVYYLDATDKIITRQDAIDKMKYVGTLADLIRTQKAATQGVLLPVPSLFSGDAETPTTMTTHTGSTTAAIMLKMREDAGNAYMGLSPENGYCVKVFATQYSHEEDSFGKDYDSAVALPGFSGSVSGTAAVETDENGLTTAEVSIGDEAGGATVPAGVQVNEGTTELSLAISQKESSESGIEKGENENLIPLDVHIDGISPDNTTPIRINLGKILPEGMNIGNVNLYHVESTGTNAMTQVFSLDELDAHNEFYYDPVTGNVTVSMATFSEVTLVNNTTNAWQGIIDINWYDTSKTELTIANVDQLAGLNKIVSGAEGYSQDSFAGKTVKLLTDIDFAGNEKYNWYPIGYWKEGGTIAAIGLDDAPEAIYEINEDSKQPGSTVSEGGENWYTYGGAFKGTFDGAGHTISNIYQNTWQLKGNYDGHYYKEAMGLFGYVYGGTVKNLTVDNFSSDGEFTPTGVIAAYAAGNATFENIAITNCNPRVYNTGNGGIIGIAGSTSAANDDHITLKNITVDNSNKISALWGSWDVACGGLVGMYRGNVDGSGNATGDTINFENCHVSAQIDVYNDVCANYQYYAYRYAGMIIGSVRHNTTNNGGKTIPNMTGISASGCTANFGTWNDYYYCEIIDNTTASYTHDYQMSRLTEIKAIDGTTITYLNDTTGTVPASGRANYVIVDYTKGDHGTENATCYHFKDGAVWTHDMGGIQTGIDENGDGQDDLKEDKQHIYLEFNNLFTGYGWGVSSMGINNWNGITALGVGEGKQEASVEKFESKFTGDFLYRVGNQNAVSVGSLFKAKDGINIQQSGVVVTIDKVYDNSTVTIDFKADTKNWTNGSIKFNGTGVVKISIQDYHFCTPTVLYLEVVDAVNATSATNAKENNVVLLNDCVFGSLEVSGGYTLYGNGFTMTCGSDSAALDMGYSFVTLNNGTLDNVQIVCPNFDYAVLYKSNMTESGNRSETTDKTRYYNVKSGVMVSGNSQILNSRISGARAAVNVTGGNVLIDNSRIELGAVASVLVGSANSLTLRDVTLVQKPTASTYDSSKTLMGFSVLFVCDADGNTAPVTLEGTLVQNAWVNESDKQYVPSAGQSIISTVLGKTEYLHDIDGDGKNESLNLGFAYMPESLTSKVNTTTITDNRTNKNDVPYDYAEVSILNGKTYVYSYKNTNGTEDGFKTESDYVSNKYGDIITVTYSDTADGLESGKSFGTDGWVYELNVDLDKLSGYKLDFGKLSMNVNGTTVTDFKVNGNAKPTSPVAVTAGGTTYTLTATVNGEEYTATYKVTGTETSKESPSKISGPTTAGFGVAKSYGGDWSGAADVLTGVKIKYWSVAENKYVEYDFSNFTVPGNAGKLNGTNSFWEYTHTNNDFTLKVTNTVAIHSGKSVYGMPIRGTDGKLYFTISSTNGYVGSGTTSRAITMQYEFTDNNGGDKLTFTHTFNISYSKDDQYSYSDLSGSGKLTKLEDSTGGSITECVTPDTLITLANGKQVRVDALTGNEQLLVWNMETGKLDSAPIMFVDSDPKAEYEVIHLYFSDGTDVKVISEHGFWDYDLNRYVYLDRNADKYIGHTFAKQSGTKLAKVKLTDVVLETEVTTAWSPVTAGHLCYFVNGMLSMPGGVGGLFNIFDVDPATMTYDYEAMAKDIEAYGLFTYEEMNAMVPLSEDMFNAAGGAYLKISIGKGNMTLDDLVNMIQRYSKYI